MNRLPSLAFLVALAGGTTFTYGAETQTRNSNNAGIAPQPLADALSAFARQQGLKLIYASDLATGQRSNGAPPGLPAVETLDRILSGTGLIAKWLNERTVSISSERDAAPAFREIIDSQPQTHTGEPAESGVAQDSVETDASSDTESNLKRPRSETPQVVALEEVVVTGTHIRGIQNPTAPITIYDRAAIERTGASSTQQFIATLPQNFAGGSLGASEDGLIGPGSLAQTNDSSASGVNLRGLGNSSTLVLINGHRVAPSAYGQTVDISLIPLGAIDRIEVLTDGSSAAYGSDAVAGVVNFVLRKEYEGAETRVNYGSVTQGSTNERIASQALGRSWGTGNALLSIDYQDRSALPANQREFSATAPEPNELLPKTQQISAIFSGHQSLNDVLDLFGDALYTHKDVTRDLTTTRGTQVSSLAKPDGLNVAAGAAYKIFDDWRLEATGLYSQQKTDYFQWINFTIPGYINGQPYSDNTARLKSLDIVTDGALWQGSAGTTRAAFGVSVRKEEFSSVLPYLGKDRTMDRTVKAGFAEVDVPLIGESNHVAIARRLSLSGAVRYDDYSDFGGTTNPRVGILWTPVGSVDLRASYSTSFRAPNPSEELQAATGQEVFNYLFPAPGGGVVPVLLPSGSLSTLLPEKSRNVSVGLEFHPEIVRGLKAAVNYYNISFRDRITSPPFDTSALLKPAIYGSLITPFTNDAQAQAYLSSLEAQGATFLDLLGTGINGVRYAYDLRQRNAAHVTQDGFDMSVEYPFSLGQSSLSVRMNASVINAINTELTGSSSATNIVNTYGNPLRYRARSDVTWSRGELEVNGAVNYSGSYVDTSTTPPGSIAAWTTVDANVRYKPRQWDGITLSVSAINLFDRNPPYAVGLGVAGIHYDVGNANPLGRFIAVDLRKDW